MSSVIKFSNGNFKPVAREVYVIDAGGQQEPEAYLPENIEFEPELEPEPEPEPEPEIDPRELAQEEAREILLSAQVQAEQIKAQAYEQGMQEGSAAGEARWLAAMEQASQVVARFNEEKEQYFTSLEPQVVKLAVEVAEKIIRRELSTSPDIVLDIVRAGIRQIKDKETIKLRVNPADVELIKQKRQDIIEAFDGVQTLEIIDDRRVERGGCAIDTPGGVLDARIKTQINEVERVLTEAATEHAGSGDTGPEQV